MRSSALAVLVMQAAWQAVTGKSLQLVLASGGLRWFNTSKSRTQLSAVPDWRLSRGFDWRYYRERGQSCTSHGTLRDEASGLEWTVVGITLPGRGYIPPRAHAADFASQICESETGRAMCADEANTLCESASECSAECWRRCVGEPLCGELISTIREQHERTSSSLWKGIDRRRAGVQASTGNLTPWSSLRTK